MAQPPTSMKALVTSFNDIKAVMNSMEVDEEIAHVPHKKARSEGESERPRCGLESLYLPRRSRSTRARTRPRKTHKAKEAAARASTTEASPSTIQEGLAFPVPNNTPVASPAAMRTTLEEQPTRTMTDLFQEQKKSLAEQLKLLNKAQKSAKKNGEPADADRDAEIQELKDLLNRTMEHERCTASARESGVSKPGRGALDPGRVHKDKGKGRKKRAERDGMAVGGVGREMLRSGRTLEERKQRNLARKFRRAARRQANSDVSALADAFASSMGELGSK